MAKFSLLDLVNQYIDDEKKRNKTMRSKSAICQWIIGDVNDELTAINKEYLQVIKDGNARDRKIFIDRIKDEFKTEYYENFLLNTSTPPETYYKNLLKPCIINVDTIKDFLSGDSGNHPKTIDFFTAFCKHQEREYGETLPERTPTPKPPPIPDDIKNKAFQIPGATIIDEAFIENVRKVKFSIVDFYTAKQYKDCQFWGILNNLDVERENYSEIKSKVLDNFNGGKNHKICGVLYGDAGTGKSIILRRLAFDLHKTDTMKIVWLNVGYVEDFIEEGFKIIENEIEKSDKTFLIIIEDWNTVFYGDRILEKRFLEKADKIDNIRVIIGDRYRTGKIYLEYLNIQSNTFELKTSENKKIISKIVERIPLWKNNFNHLFENNNADTSLFLLLFVLARLQDNSALLEVDLSEPETVFSNIIKDDLKFIANHSEGLAKGLYYWSCIYKKYKLNITYDSFLIISDFYNNDKKVSLRKRFCDFQNESPLSQKLRKYLNKKDVTIFYEKQKNLISFNHDLFADIGLSNCPMETWETFNSVIEKEIVEVLIDNGDALSSSNLLGKYILESNKNYKNSQILVEFFKKSLLKGNDHFYYIRNFLDTSIGVALLTEEFVEKVWQAGNYSTIFWSYILENGTKKNTDYWINKILATESLDKFPSFWIIHDVVHQYSTEEIISKFVVSVLKEEKWNIIPPKIVFYCFQKSEDKILKQDYLSRNSNDIKWLEKFSTSIDRLNNDEQIVSILSDFALSQTDWEKYKDDDISFYLRESKNKKIKKIFVKNILGNPNWWNISPVIVIECVKQVEKKDEKQKTIKSILKYWESAPSSIIIGCIEECLDENINESIFNKVLNVENWKKNDAYFVRFCLNKTKDEDLRKNFCISFLNTSNLENKNYLLSEVLKISTKSNLFSYLNSGVLQKIVDEGLNKIADLTNDQNYYFVKSILNSPIDDNIKKGFYRKLLENEFSQYTQSEIYCVALHMVEDPTVRQKFINNVLTEINNNIKPVLFYNLILFNKDILLAENVFKLILRNITYFNWRVVRTAFLFMKDKVYLKNFVDTSLILYSPKIGKRKFKRDEWRIFINIYKLSENQKLKNEIQSQINEILKKENLKELDHEFVFACLILSENNHLVQKICDKILGERIGIYSFLALELSENTVLKNDFINKLQTEANVEMIFELLFMEDLYYLYEDSDCFLENIKIGRFKYFSDSRYIHFPSRILYLYEVNKDFESLFTTLKGLFKKPDVWNNCF